MKRVIKNPIFTFILGGIIFSSVSIYAYVLTAQQVGYTPSDNTWNVTDVNGALNDIYDMLQARGSAASGVITNVNNNTEYTINTGLSSIKSFCAFQSPMSGSGNGNIVSIYDSDFNGYYIAAQYVSGIRQTVNYNAIGTSAGTGNSTSLFIYSINGGIITIHTGAYNTDYNKRDIHWFAQ